MSDVTRTAHPAAAAGGDPPAGPHSAAVPGFDLLAEVGRGGMGVVWRARDVALDREVAVKLLGDKYAPDSATARRFLDEARITGQLQHPGIPAVYQVGALGDGRPFLAMKLIKGDTLADRLRAGEPVDARGVFAAIAQAVGYAHAHGVIHRDLKPANVMVGAHGEVQVLDWGLAKVLTAGRPREGTAGDPEATVAAATEIKSARDGGGSVTEYGSVLGTPAFMAPEQAAGETDRTDARSDVFGLGAVLCVLLTGKPPFDGKDAESVRLNAVRGKTEAAFARLDASGADPGVVALCKRCLAAEPADRPASGDVVAAEVAALRAAADDRARRAETAAAEERVRRRVQLRWGGLAAAVLLLGVAGTTVGLIRADAARRAAETAELATEAKRVEAAFAKAEAVAKAAEANAVVQFFEDKVFAAARPKSEAGGLGPNVTLAAAINAGLPALATGFADQPLVEARLRTTVGDTMLSLGNYFDAVSQCERAQALYTEHQALDSLQSLRNATVLANGYDVVGRHPDALALREKTLATRRRLLPPDDRETLRSMERLARSYERVNRVEALRLREEVLAIQRRVLPPDDRDTLQSLQNLAAFFGNSGRLDDAIRVYSEVLATCRRVLPPDHPSTLRVVSNLGINYLKLGRHEDALKMHSEALAGRRRALTDYHPDTITSMSFVAQSLDDLNRSAEALPLIDEMLKAASKLPAYNPDDIWRAVGVRSQHYRRAGDPAACRTTAETLEKFNGASRRVDITGLYNAACLRAVASEAYARAKQPAEATADADRAMAWLTKAVAAGVKDRLQAEFGDEDLAALRGRADFRALMAKLPPITDVDKITTTMESRIYRRQKAGDLSGCRAVADEFEHLNFADFGNLYEAACFRAIVAAVQAKAAGPDAARLATTEADRAMAWLTKAVAAGYKDRAHMEQDADLALLRDRADYRALLNGLPAPPRPDK